jgi:hypothetical protein
MPQEGRSGKSLANDGFQPAPHLAACLAPAPPRRLTSELQRPRGHGSQFGGTHASLVRSCPPATRGRVDWLTCWIARDIET